MAKLEVFEAAKEGFRLIRREPTAVLAWSVVSFVLMGAPMVAMVSQLARTVGQPGLPADADMATESLSGLLALLPLSWLGTIAGYVLIGGAVFRAVISPSDRTRFYLRISRAEGWMVLSAVTGAVMAYIAFMVVMMALMFAVFVPLSLAMTVPNDGAESFTLVSLLPLILLLAVYPAAAYFGLRFSMAPLMSFDERRFRLFESWSLTRGQGWRLVGLWLLLFVATIAFELMVLVVVPILGGPNFFSLFGDPTELQMFAERLWAFYASPWVWLVAAIGAVFAGPLMALLIAPWARAYLMLRDATAEPA